MNDCNAEHQQLIDDCETREQRLSEWERDFMDSIKARLAVGKALSTTQAQKLEEIWERATEKG
jgi:hypothetical protein